MQLDKTKKLTECLIQNHLQLDMLNFDPQILLDLMLVSDLNFMDVHMVYFFIHFCHFKDC